jgi:hypothetical protein
LKSKSGTVIVDGDILLTNARPKTVSVSNIRVNPYPDNQKANISNWILWDLYQDSSKMVIKDLSKPFLMNIYVEKSLLSGKDDDEIALTYFDEASKTWDTVGTSIFDRLDHNSTHDIICGETNHLTTFVIAATEFSFDGSWVISRFYFLFMRNSLLPHIDNDFSISHHVCFLCLGKSQTSTPSDRAQF